MTQNGISIQDEGITIATNIGVLNFAGAGVSGSVLGNVVTETITGGGSGSTTPVDQIMTDSGDHTNFTITNSPISGSLQVFNNSTGQIVPAASYSVVATTITFSVSQAQDNGDGTFVTPQFRATYSF